MNTDFDETIPLEPEPGDENPEIRKNRIKDLQPEKGKTFNWKSPKPVLILAAIAALSLLLILIIVKFANRESKVFAPQEKTPFERVEKEIKTESENIHIKRGKESYAKGFFNDAVAEFKEVVESDASDKDKAIALTYLGMISDERGKYEEAVDFYKRAIAYDRENPDIYKNISLSYRHLGDHENAITYAKKSMALNPKDVNTKILLGNIYYDLARYDDAVKMYREALEISPDNAAVQFNLASALMKSGDEFAAVEFFKKAGASDRIGEVAYRAYSRLGVIFTERKNFPLAEQYLKNALSIRPNDAVSRYNLGIAFLRQKKTKEALEEFTMAEELGRGDSQMLENLGEAFFSLGEYDRSLGSYKKVLASNGRNVRILSRVGEIYYEKGDLDSAFESFKKITMIEPATENARIAYLNMGNILDDAHRFEESIEAYQKAITISPKDDTAFYNLGIAYKHVGKPEMAVNSWDEAARLNEKNPKPHLAIADYYYESKLYDLAESKYQRILARWPDIQEGHFKIGTIYYKKNQPDYALKAYRKVVEINDSNDLARKAYINMAIISSKDARDEKSIEESSRTLQKALLLKPGDSEALFSLGIIYSKKNMHDRAIDTFYQALKATNEPGLIAEAYNNIGKSYFKKKLYKKALQAFTRGVEEDPSNEEIRMNRKVAMQAYESDMAKE